MRASIRPGTGQPCRRARLTGRPADATTTHLNYGVLYDRGAHHGPGQESSCSDGRSSGGRSITDWPAVCIHLAALTIAPAASGGVSSHVRPSSSRPATDIWTRIMLAIPAPRTSGSGSTAPSPRT